MSGTETLHRAKEARRRLGNVSKPTFYKWLNGGLLKAVKIGGATFVTDEEIRRFTEALPAYEPAAAA
jgi:hypothetical protein